MQNDRASAPPSAEYLPWHIGIIMDGNGRWAKARGLAREFGHRRGSEVFMEIARYCKQIGIKYLTVYAFSTENWKRPPHEVAVIMQMLQHYLDDSERYKREKIRLRIIGVRSRLSEQMRKSIEKAEQASAGFDALTVNLAVNYGGREELLHAAKALAQRCQEGTEDASQIDIDRLESFLYTAGQPDPDLIIRPSGEKRLSNFMMWQSAYAEFVFMDVLWPDFTPRHLNEALWEYAERDRRFGGI